MVAGDKGVALQLKLVVGYEAISERIRVQSHAHGSQNQEMQGYSAGGFPLREPFSARGGRPFRNLGPPAIAPLNHFADILAWPQRSEPLKVRRGTPWAWRWNHRGGTELVEISLRELRRIDIGGCVVSANHLLSELAEI